jgi:hypothetical protein
MPRAGAALTLCLLLLAGACAPTGGGPVLALPERPEDAPAGAEFAAELEGLDFPAREQRVLEEVARGNVPGSLRRLKRVEVRGVVGGRERRVEFWVTPDYLAVGSDEDSFLVPLSAGAAGRVAALAAGSLPAPRMVDAVWAAARVRLMPIRIRPDEHLRSLWYFQRHSNLVRAQQWQQRVRPGMLVAGHKLDVVRFPPGAAEDLGVYGWHFPDATPIQPAHAVQPGAEPVFSMGVRIVHRDITVDGVAADLDEALRDAGLAKLLGG